MSQCPCPARGLIRVSSNNSSGALKGRFERRNGNYPGRFRPGTPSVDHPDWPLGGGFPVSWAELIWTAGRFASPVEIPRLPSAPFSRIVGPHEDFRTHARSRCLRDDSYTRGKNTRKEDCRIWSTFLLPGAREVVVPTASSFAFLSSARERTRMAPWRV